MAVEVFDGEIKVHYGFGYLNGSDEEPPDMDEARVGHRNGLCCGGVTGALSMMFGLHTGGEPFRIEWSEIEPALDDSWEEVVETSVTFQSPDLLLSTFDEFNDVTIPAAGTHRARFCATGMDAANELDSRDEGAPAPDRYLLQLWPAPPAADAVVRQTSQIADYWHRVARGEAS